MIFRYTIQYISVILHFLNRWAFNIVEHSAKHSPMKFINALESLKHKSTQVHMQPSAIGILAIVVTSSYV